MGWLGDLLKGGVTLGATALGGPLVGGAVGGVLSGAGKGAKADKYNQRATDIADQRYQAGAPYRSKLAQIALNLPRNRPDLSGIFADAGNVYQRPVSRLASTSLQQPVAPSPIPRGPLPTQRPRSLLTQRALR